VAVELLRSDEFIKHIDAVFIDNAADQWVQRIYRKGEVVKHFVGRSYIAQVDTADEPGDSADWKRLGTDGLRDVGGHDEARQYEPGDIYHKDGSTFFYDGANHRLLAAKPLTKAELDKAVKAVERTVAAQVQALAQKAQGHDTALHDVEQALVAVDKAMTGLVAIQEADTPINRWAGDWSPIPTYSRGDVVRYGGRLYVCNGNGSSIEAGFELMLAAGGSSMGGGGSFDLADAINDAALRPAVDGTEVVPVTVNGALRHFTISEIFDKVPSLVPTVPVYIEAPIAGGQPTRAELSAAYASKGIPLTANADAYIRDTSGVSKLFRVSFRKDPPTQNPAGDFYFIKLDGPV
jgi:hypothetical protein